MKRLIALAATAALSGCVAAVPEQENGAQYPQAELIGTAGNSRLYVFNDREAGNVCYYVGRNAGPIALSCVPARYER